MFTWASKNIWFLIKTLHHWFKKYAPLFHPIRIKAKPIAARSHTFSRASRKVQEFTTNVDWLIGLSCPLWLATTEWLFWFWLYDTHLKTALTKRVLTNPRFYHISLPVELQESWVVIQLRFSIGRHSLQLLQFALYKKKIPQISDLFMALTEIVRSSREKWLQ